MAWLGLVEWLDAVRKRIPCACCDTRVVIVSPLQTPPLCCLLLTLLPPSARCRHLPAGARRSLGANDFQVFWNVTLPNIRWGLLYGIILTNAVSEPWGSGVCTILHTV